MMKSARILYLLYCCKYLREENKAFDNLNFKKLKALDNICHQLSELDY